MFKVYDISMTVQPGMAVWGNAPAKQPELRTLNPHPPDKNGVYETELRLGVHTGTHLDAPLHMLADGDTIETISLQELVGSARVVDLTHVRDGIGRADLEPLGLVRGDWVLFKTINSETDTFEDDFIYLREDGARYLIEVGVRGIGTDALGIERSQPEYPTHRLLFRNRILIVEGLRLKEVAAGTYFMVIAPLKLSGIEAAPARALLIGS
ncbi:cyclase family protein [Paenibacillus albicereus]|uniref:Kynurenine formamidase n=1 Tax=Paenibacillus albicereus TaxID=2726185 RepID=A0A6H2GV15_9BACL|nr:cyclase family protein [Paenibacillus albicereus]QJC51232.1 cyclase family protein [Paenibacillus albicereus]